MTDTPINHQPVTKLDAFKACVGDLARPFAIYVTSFGAAVATVIIAHRIASEKLDLSAAAIFIGAVFTGVGALYTAKAWEKTQQTKADADVAKTQAQVNGDVAKAQVGQ